MSRQAPDIAQTKSAHCNGVCEGMVAQKTHEAKEQRAHGHRPHGIFPGERTAGTENNPQMGIHHCCPAGNHDDIEGQEEIYGKVHGGAQRSFRRGCGHVLIKVGGFHRGDMDSRSPERQKAQVAQGVEPGVFPGAGLHQPVNAEVARNRQRDSGKAADSGPEQSFPGQGEIGRKLGFQARKLHIFYVPAHEQVPAENHQGAQNADFQQQCGFPSFHSRSFLQVVGTDFVSSHGNHTIGETIAQAVLPGVLPLATRCRQWYIVQ